jgi:two-component system, cell cycle sensor histidine kinase and response regulator CckA
MLTAGKEALDRELQGAILDGMGEAMIAACGEGRIILFNKMAETITGWRGEEALGRPLEEIYQSLDETARRPRTGLVADLLAPRLPPNPSKPVILIDKAGNRRSIEESCSPIRDREGSILGVAILFRDIGARLKLEQEALKTEKLKALALLAGGIAHDFNNLLTAVLGNISLAKLHADPRSRIVNNLAAAEKASLRTRDLTQQLLTFARGGAPIKELTALGELVKDAASSSLRGSEVELDLTLQRELRAVEVDQGQMRQVIDSLLLNAAQAMAGSGTVEVRVENIDVGEEEVLPLAPGAYVKITIKDNGRGISREHLPHIFDPYFTTSQQGSGLGLASSYSVVRRHCGHLGVESALGAGTTFAVYLPASRRQPAINPATTEASRSGEGRVLVMDDEAVIRETAGDLLGHLGYEVDFAVSGEEAIRKYEAAIRAGLPYRLVMMDLTVPGGMGGREAVRWLLDLDPAARVVVSSGFAGDPAMTDYERYGFSGALIKPYNLKELVRTINRLLGEPEYHLAHL